MKLNTDKKEGGAISASVFSLYNREGIFRLLHKTSLSDSFQQGAQAHERQRIREQLRDKALSGTNNIYSPL